MVKKILGHLGIAGILALVGANVASAQGLVPMHCSTVYGKGPVVYYPASVRGAGCWLVTRPGTVVYGIFLPR